MCTLCTQSSKGSMHDVHSPEFAKETREPGALHSALGKLARIPALVTRTLHADHA
jgi:hypothetical protein